MADKNDEINLLALNHHPETKRILLMTIPPEIAENYQKNRHDSFHAEFSYEFGNLAYRPPSTDENINFMAYDNRGSLTIIKEDGFYYSAISAYRPLSPLTRSCRAFLQSHVDEDPDGCADDVKKAAKPRSIPSKSRVIGARRKQFADLINLTKKEYDALKHSFLYSNDVMQYDGGLEDYKDNIERIIGRIFMDIPDFEQYCRDWPVGPSLFDMIKCESMIESQKSKDHTPQFEYPEKLKGLDVFAVNCEIDEM